MDWGNSSHWKVKIQVVSDLYTGNSLNDSQKLKRGDNRNDIPYVSSKDIDVDSKR